ncbi:MAG: DUF3048 domain-containing protein [Clostridia bacterium]|jgi:hypothetical protein|nr:DUF3048 domain-containing protein [Clostridia bacterium]
MGKNKLLIIIFMLLLVFTVSCGGPQADKPAEPNPAPQEEANAPEDEEEQQAAEQVFPQEPELPGALLVMVDNYKKARPQAGLDKADMVYEIMAEGGITRYMGIFYHQKAEKIGPVRSARYYFVELAKGFNSPLAHAGGSTEALNMLVSLKIKDMDEIYNAGAYFWRDKQRKMPHNLYTSTEQLIKGAKNKGYALVPLEALPQGTAWQGAPQGAIGIDYSQKPEKYLVAWKYQDNRYIRQVNGEPYLLEDGAAIIADNIIIITAKTRSFVKDGVVLSDIDIIGKGEARYLIEGKMMKGSWKKETAGKMLEFLDEGGSPMTFKQGRTWVQVVPDLNSLILG